MGFRKLFCPNCGASIELDDSREIGFCLYCGSKIVQDKLIVEHRGSVSVSGVADVGVILDRAKLYLEDMRFTDAYKYCERALDINPRNADAYLLRLMAETQCAKQEELCKNIKPLNMYDSYNKALRFSSSEMKKKLGDYCAQSYANFANEKQKRLNQIDDKQKMIDDMKSNLSELSERVRKNQKWIHRKSTEILFLVLLGTFDVLAFFVCLKLLEQSIVIAAVLYALVFIVTLVAVIVFKILEKRALKYYQDYQNYGHMVNQAMVEIQKEISKYKEWENRMMGAV